MPTYEYKCFACNHSFEQFQSIKADPIRRCPACGKMKVKRLLGTGAGLIFKGSGFYITDYRSEGYKKAQGAEAGTGGGSGAGEKKSGEGGAKTEPAAKPTAKSPEGGGGGSAPTGSK